MGPALMAESIGERVQRLREAKGMTQKALADAADVGLSALFQLEQNVVSNPRVNTLAKIARVLGVSLDELVGPPSEG